VLPANDDAAVVMTTGLLRADGLAEAGSGT
jgi:hypothetical protein